MHEYSVYDPHSQYAWSIYHLSVGVLIVMFLILLLIVSLVSFCCLHYRESRHPKARLSFGSRKMELIYTIIPLAIVGTITFFTFTTMQASDPAATRRDDVVVVGHQWWWEVRYPGTGIVTANEVHIPVRDPMLVGLESADVIHDFWVPELARKMDMTPGYHRKIWIAADHSGNYYGTCAEYCGKEHAWMRIRVIAQTPADFAAWESAQEQVPATPTSGDAAKGAHYFQQMSCASCHAIRGTNASGMLGPNLTHLASRETLATGRLANTSQNLYNWLKDPDRYKPGVHMPNLGLTDEQAHDLVAYLEGLR